MGTLDDVNPTRLSKQSQGCPLTVLQEQFSYEMALIASRLFSDPIH